MTELETMQRAKMYLDKLANGIRACLKNVQHAQRRVLFRDILPLFLGIHKVFLRKIVFISQKNPSPLCIFPLFKQALVLDGINRGGTPCF